MEQFEQRVLDFQQKLALKKELEAQIPQAQARRMELKESLPQLRVDQAAAKFDLNKAEEPGFFQRLLGNQGERLAKARTAYRNAAIALDTAQRELRELEDRLERDQETLASLAGCRDGYLQFLEAHLDTVPAARDIRLRQLVSDAIAASKAMSDTLVQSRTGMRRDVLSTRVYPGDRKMAILAEADAYAAEFCAIMKLLPEGIVSIGASLSCPSAYITGATMESAQLDRMNSTLNRAREAREQLRAYLGGL